MLCSPAFLPRRPRALPPCRPADSQPGSMDVQDTSQVPIRADRSALSTICWGDSRRANWCQETDLSLERPLVHTRLRQKKNRSLPSDSVYSDQRVHRSPVLLSQGEEREWEAEVDGRLQAKTYHRKVATFFSATGSVKMFVPSIKFYRQSPLIAALWRWLKSIGGTILKCHPPPPSSVMDERHMIRRWPTTRRSVAI